jgi:SPP1 family phage portal protein
MRKIKLDKNVVITKELIQDLIKEHTAERSRILKMKNYYNGINEAIKNRRYEDTNKPSNRLYSGYASYITDNFVGYMLGQPISYKSDNTKLLEELNLHFLYNDEIDNNTTLAQEQSICGYAYELLYTDEDSNVRFKALDTEDVIVVYENTLEEKELFVIRYIVSDENKGMVYLYTKEEIKAYSIENGELGTEIEEESQVNVFFDIPICTYENNRQRIGDFEKVLSLIDAYDFTNSDTANDFEYFTNALLVISGVTMNETDEQDRPLNFKDNRVINFIDTNSKAEYLIKDINDTALENYKNRLNLDIHKFSNVIDISDKNFGNNLSGIAMKYKLLGMENIASIKESKFRKGLMKRIELLTHFLNLASTSDYLYTEITPVFTRNIPSNDVETVEMIKQLYGMISDKTLLSQLPFIEDVQQELNFIEEQRKSSLDYQDLGVEDEE